MSVLGAPAAERTAPPAWAHRTSVYQLWRDLDGTFCRSTLTPTGWRTWRTTDVSFPDRYPQPPARKARR